MSIFLLFPFPVSAVSVVWTLDVVQRAWGKHFYLPTSCTKEYIRVEGRGVMHIARSGHIFICGVFICGDILHGDFK